MMMIVSVAYSLASSETFALLKCHFLLYLLEMSWR